MSILKLRKTVYACILAGCAGLLFSGMSAAVSQCEEGDLPTVEGACVCTVNPGNQLKCKRVTE
jgi:hypothetical protein